MTCFIWCKSIVRFSEHDGLYLSLISNLFLGKIIKKNLIWSDDMTTRRKDRTPLQKLLEWRTKGRVFVPNARQSWCRDPLTKRLSCWAWWPTYSGSNAYAKMIRLIFAASCPRAKWYITVISWTVTNNSRIIRKRYCVNIIIIMIFADGNDHELKAYYYNDYKYCCNRSPAKENAKKLSSYAPATASSIVTYFREKIDELSRITPEHSSYLKRYPKCDVYIYLCMCVLYIFIILYLTPAVPDIQKIMMTRQCSSIVGV